VYPVIKRGKWITLREFDHGDVDALTAVYGDKETTRHLSFEPRTREQVASIIERSVTSASAERRVEYALAAVENETGQLIGTWRLAYAPISAAPPSTVGEHGDTAQFGCAIAARTWRKGYGTEGTSLLLSLAFDDLGIARVWGARGPENEASAVLMRRLGFVDVERFPDHITKYGRPRDSIAAALDRDAWSRSATS
jgi:[ribosomal protein S5]-alanine N-acetyltransferase